MSQLTSAIRKGGIDFERSKSNEKFSPRRDKKKKVEKKQPKEKRSQRASRVIHQCAYKSCCSEKLTHRINTPDSFVGRVFFFFFSTARLECVGKTEIDFFSRILLVHMNTEPPKESYELCIETKKYPIFEGNRLCISHTRELQWIFFFKRRRQKKVEKRMYNRKVER